MIFRNSSKYVIAGQGIARKRKRLITPINRFPENVGTNERTLFHISSYFPIKNHVAFTLARYSAGAGVREENGRRRSYFSGVLHSVHLAVTFTWCIDLSRVSDACWLGINFRMVDAKLKLDEARRFAKWRGRTGIRRCGSRGSVVRRTVDRPEESGSRCNVTSRHVFESTSRGLCTRCLPRIEALHRCFSIFHLPHGASSAVNVCIPPKETQPNSTVSHFGHLSVTRSNFSDPVGNLFVSSLLSRYSTRSRLLP